MSLAIAVTALLCATPVLAASQQDRDNCDKESMAKAIAACTAVIEDTSTPAAVSVYINRAAAYYALGDYDRSIADYSEAIRFDPQNTNALFGRGTAKRRKGDLAGAEADFVAGRAVKAADQNQLVDAERQRAQDIQRIQTLTARQTMARNVRQQACNEQMLRQVAIIRQESAQVEWDLALTRGDAAKLCEYGKNTGLPRLARETGALADFQDWASSKNCDDSNYSPAVTRQMMAYRNNTRAVAADCERANVPPPPLAAEMRHALACSEAPIQTLTNNAVASCTEVINAPGELPQGRRAAYIRRAVLRHKTDYDGSIADLDAAVALASESPTVYARRCWARAIVGRELDKALADCNRALDLAPEFYGGLDSRGLVYLQMGEFDKAIADYDAALDIAPALATSLYGRGIAKRRKGDAGAGEADVALSYRVEPEITTMMAGYGVR